jgi:hypothetical protein
MAAFQQFLVDGGSAGALPWRGAQDQARLEKSWIAARSSVLEAPRRVENSGVESAQNNKENRR